jgi:catechol 2,3-dioxygenase-like lactoylglutathione lyase family enzyme
VWARRLWKQGLLVSIRQPWLLADAISTPERAALAVQPGPGSCLRSREERLLYPVAVPESHAGRLFDHVHLRVADVEASKRFYAGALAPLGLGITGEGEGWFSADELFVSDDGPATSGLHVAFQAQDRETVDRFHAAAIESGGRDNGAPGERSYHPGYYAAYVLDPDGTNVEAVYHGPTKRSTPSVVFNWDA